MSTILRKQLDENVIEWNLALADFQAHVAQMDDPGEPQWVEASEQLRKLSRIAARSARILEREQQAALDDRPVDTSLAHSTHCCPIHGCQYGHDHYGETACPITRGAVAPVYGNSNGCEQCEDGD
jgi:hypothetical protein